MSKFIAGSFNPGGLKTDATIPAYVPDPSRFDVRRALYRGERDTLDRWDAALARASAGGANAHLLVLGDSISQGASVSPATTFAWPSILARALQDKWGWPGGYGWDTFNDEGNTFANPGMVITGFVADGNRGLYGEARTSTANGQTITYGPIPVKTFRIRYANRVGGGSFTYAIDGGSTTTVNTANATESIQTVSISAGFRPAEPHTLTITALGANVTILAIEASVQDNGRVKVTRAARNGAKIGDAIVATNPTSSLSLWSSLAPDLTVIMLETNDFQGQLAVATYKSRMATAIQAAQAVNSDVLLVTTVTPNVNPGGITLAQYTTALYELADQYNVALLDMQYRWGSYAVANAAPFLYYDDNLHPSQRGRTEIARAVYSAVLTDGFMQRPPVMLDQAQSWTAVQTFGYPGSADEQLMVGGADALAVDFTNSPRPFVAAGSLGELVMGSKGGVKGIMWSGMKMYAQRIFNIGSGTTAQRPSATTAAVGGCYFDTTLGKPIWSDGTNWKDATGTTV